MSKQRIAILGGGMGSLTTAFELTSVPGWSERYDITVYQTGWRLGGKGASGRNRDVYERIEEHGLHLMFGFYDNVFRVMKQAYDELGRNPTQPLATWQDAFKPHDLIVMMQEVGKGQFVPWEVSPPPNGLEPGISTPIAGPFEYLIRLLEKAVHLFHGWTATTAHAQVASAARVLGLEGEHAALVAEVRRIKQKFELPHAAPEPEGIFDRIEQAVVDTVRGFINSPHLQTVMSQLVFLDLAHGLARTTPCGDRARQLDAGEMELIPWLLRKFLDWMWTTAKDISIELHRLFLEIDFGLTIAIGMIVDGLILPPVDWFKIDDHDFRSWLRKHGAREETIDSPLVWGLYDAIFSTDAKVGAGTIVHLFLLMGLEYKGSVLYKMQAGMGDTIFTPLYQVLERRGVKFEFFHTVHNLALSQDGSRIERIEMGIQATIKPEYGGKYQPLVPVKGLDCWPSTPNYEYLVEGEILKKDKVDLENFWSTWKDVGEKTLEAGKDFDVCVLGISIGAFPFICKELIDHAPHTWGAMVEGVKTCQTAALQLWFAPGVAQTGWKTASPQKPVVIPYVEPLDTWCCMDQLIDKEDWPPHLPVGSLHYLCSNLIDVEPVPPRSDHGYPARQDERLKQISIKWLEENVKSIWPRAAMPATPDQLNWWWLVDPQNRQGRERFDSQYWHAVNSPSERYVLAVPGATAVRLRADESGFDNLVLAGDWTLTALSAGCLEATAMSGIMAATAVDGVKRYIAYDWLPKEQRERPVRPPASFTAPPVEGAPRPFIPRDGQLMATPPISMKTTLYTYLLDADLDAIRAMCDRYLNLGGPTVYRPLVPWVTLYCSYAESAPVNNPIGWCPEKDFGFWVPVVAGRVEGSLFIPEKMQVFTPYLWVDSGVAMVGGREVYGFPKELGEMTMPAKVGDPARFTVDTLVIPKYGPDSRTVNERILDVKRMDASVWEELEQVFADGDTFLKAIEELFAQHGPGRFPVPDGKLFLQFLTQVGRQLPMVFLKQFPGIGEGPESVYQAIVEAPVAITSGVSGGWLPGEYEIDLWSFDSHEIVKNLGLRVHSQDGNKAQLRSLAHMWMKFDGLVKGGRVVHQRK
jgi:uncharacterized protein with NAD-binding domain and iron-sulfur cluster